MPVNVICANDLGAAAVKIATGPAPSDVLTMPTYLLKDPYLRLLETPSDPIRAVHLSVATTPCGITGEFAFGQLAMENRGQAVSGKVNKLSDDMIRYAQVSALFVAAAMAKEKGMMGITIGLESLLPLLDFREREQRLAWGAQFKGFYSGSFVESSNPRWARLGTLMFTVERHLVGCEGAPVVALTPAPAPGAEWRAVGDGGGSTLDIPVFRLLPSGEYELHTPSSMGAEIGLNDAMDALTTDVNRAFGRKLTREDVARILVDRQGDMPNGAGSPISILPIAERHLSGVAKDVAAHLVEVWIRRPEIGTFELIGGGPQVLGPFLNRAVEQLMEQRRLSGRFSLKTLPNARVANALAAYAQAQRVFGNG